jgi:hypothetical protein
MTFEEKKKRITELDKLIKQKEALYNQAKAMQLGLKTVINGTYGAFAHPKFVVSNFNIANSITIHGRDVILYMLDKIENYFYNLWHKDDKIHELLKETYIGIDKDFNAYMLNNKNEIIYNSQSYSKELENSNNEKKEKSAIFNLLKDWNINPEKIEKIEEEKVNIGDKEIIKKFKRKIHNFENIKQIDGTIIGDREKMDNWDTKFHKEDVIIYGDTDSIFNKSKIKTDKGEYTIEDLYNMNEKNGSNGITLKGHESVKCNQKVLNWNEEKKLYYAPVKRIIRHKVKKSKWKLKTKSGKEIIVTNDHSMIIFRNNKKLEVKPSEILKTDKILSVFEK